MEKQRFAGKLAHNAPFLRMPTHPPFWAVQKL